MPEKSFLVENVGAGVQPPGGGAISGNDHKEQMSLDPSRVTDTIGVASSVMIRRAPGRKLSSESKRHTVGDSDNC